MLHGTRALAQHLRRRVIEQIAILAVGIQRQLPVTALVGSGVCNRQPVADIDVGIVGQHIAHGFERIVFSHLGCIGRSNRTIVDVKHTDREGLRSSRPGTISCHQ